MFGFDARKAELVAESDALPGRADAMPIAAAHSVLGHRMKPPYPAEIQTVLLGMGCFWGAERLFWQQPGVWTTAVGYAGGFTANPTYQEVCSGRTGHTGVVLVAFDPSRLSFEAVLQRFWEGHDPTQGMRQGADRGTQYRSAIYTSNDEQHAAARRSREIYQVALARAGRGGITTEIRPNQTLYFAEDYHQQYLHKNPTGYCGIGGTGVSCPTGLGVAAGPSTEGAGAPEIPKASP